MFGSLQPGGGARCRSLHLPPQGIEAALLEIYSIQELPLSPCLGWELSVNLGRGGATETRGLTDLATALAPRINTLEARLEEVTKDEIVGGRLREGGVLMEAHLGVHGVRLVLGQGKRRWPDPGVHIGDLETDSKRVVVREEPWEKAHFDHKILELGRQQQKVGSGGSFAGGCRLRSPPFSGEVLGINPAPVKEELGSWQVCEVIVEVASQKAWPAAKRK